MRCFSSMLFVRCFLVDSRCVHASCCGLPGCLARWLYVADADIAARHGVYGQCRYAFEPQFLHYVAAVGYHGGQADVEHVGDFFVYVSFYDEAHHFSLTRGQLVLLSRLWRQVAPCVVARLLKREQRPYQLLFGDGRADAVESGDG